MQVVINIDDAVYKRAMVYKDELFPDDALLGTLLIIAVNNGVQLPSGHGRLIDADVLEKKMCDREEELGDDRALWESSAVSVALDMFAPTIVDADRNDE
jgi:hypothetical protein